MGVDRVWIRREAKCEGGLGGKLNAGRQLTDDEMWGMHRAHRGAHGDVARHNAIFFADERLYQAKVFLRQSRFNYERIEVLYTP